MKKLFGTDGIRGEANVELTAELAFNVGRYASKVLGGMKAKPSENSTTIVIGKDTRISCDMLEAAISAGALSMGANVVCVGVVPTPALPHIIKAKGADMGIMISASHNPAIYNGIKLFNRDGLKLKDEIENIIESMILERSDLSDYLSSSNLGNLVHDLGASKIYEDKLISSVDFSLAKLKLGIDCANGSNYSIAPSVFKSLGAELHAIGTEPNGFNINDNCGSTHLSKLRNLVLSNKLDIGLAFDGDADRLLAIDEKGEVIDGDRIVLAFAKRMLKQGSLVDDTVVVTVMSNMGLFKALEKEGIRVEKTKVGDRYVLDRMLTEGFNVGGEQSGHIILSDFNTTGDGLYTALKLLEVLTKDVDKASEISAAMQDFPHVLKNANVPNHLKYSIAEFEELREAIREVESKLGDSGRVLLRASGTEPLVRVMIEGDDERLIETCADELIALIQEIVGRVKNA